MPALLARAPPKLGFDEEMKVFVANFDQHDEYRRGRAVDKQGQQSVDSSTGMQTHTVVEESEEVRLLASQCLLSLIERLTELDSLAVLNPYFADLVLYLQCQLRDLFPELKQVAAKALELLALLQEFESGMCYFAVALVRMLLPLLRHRHAKVRVAGIDALRACMVVPNRAKRKGSGTEAIVDLVGFKEDNLLNVAAFYKPVTSINYLAELTSDPIVLVRERVVVMLKSFLVDLEDRYDHQQRLLPYLLDMLTDESPSVSSVALATLVRCGELYEEQHTDDIIERRQFGIDGDDRCNLDKPLPAPFTERPRIGIRIYTRGNTKRFIFALVGELTNWQSKTRMKSANLLKMVTVLCEEYLTMEMHKLLPSYIKALQYARDDGDKELEAVLCEVYELAGRYTAPDSYIHYILPRLCGDVEVTQFGIDATTRCCVIDVLKCFVDGSKNSLIPPYLSEIVDAIVDPYVIDPTSELLHGSALRLMVMVLSKVQGKGLAMTAAHFQSTGRLKNMKDTIHKAFRFIFHALSVPDLNAQATDALTLLSNLDSESHIIAQGVQGLLLKQIPTLVNSLIDPLLVSDSSATNDDIEDIDGDVRVNVDLDDIFELDSPETRLLELSLLCPLYPLQGSKVSSSHLFTHTLSFLIAVTSTLTRSMMSSVSSSSGIQITSSLPPSEDPSTLLKKYADYMIYALDPFMAAAASESIDDSASSKFFGVLCSREAVAPPVVSALEESRTVLKDFFPSIISTFVTPAAWSKDVALQQKRLSVLSSLLQVLMITSDTSSEEKQELLNPVLKSLMDTVFKSALSPSTPLEIRLTAADLFKSVLSIYYDDSRRLVSYAKQALVPDSSGGSQESSSEIKQAILAALNVIMSVMLDDSNDAIRIVSLESLMHVISFVRPHYDQNVNSQPPSPPTTAALPSFVPTSTSFEGMIDALLMRAVNGNPTEDFFNQLDFVLRSLAPLNLSKFEEVVRSKLPLLVGLHAPPSAASDMFSGLLDHAEMLMQFAAAK